MIDKLTLKNFQAHKQSELKLGPGVNAIIGESDEGKTSIIRALYWTAQNKPSGGDFISDFSKRGECSSTIEIDGQEVTRFKNKTKNEYRINDQAFKALGKSGVPDEVKTALNLDDLNFQNQMDSPFLLSSSAGEVARYLNDIVNLNVIDDSLKRINSRTNTAARDIESVESEINNNADELVELAWIVKAEIELNDLEDDQLEFKNDQSLQEYLIDTLEEAEELTDQLAVYKDTAVEEGLIIELLSIITDYSNAEINLFDFKDHLNACKTILAERDGLLLDSNEIDSIDALDSLIAKYQGLSNVLNDFDEHLILIDNLTDEIEKLNSVIVLDEDKFKMEFPDVCPLCGDME